MNKTIINIFGIILSVAFIWIFIFFIWYSQNIVNKNNFVNKTTSVLQTEVVRDAISNEIIDIVKQKRPVIGTLSAPVLSNVITGVLDTNLFANVYSRLAGELHLQLTTKNPRPLEIDVEQTKQFIAPLISSQDSTILNDFPNKIVIVKKNQIPSLYHFGTYLGILGPILLIVAILILGSMYIKARNKRNYLSKLFIVVVAFGVLIYFFIPTLGTYIGSNFNSVNISIIVNEVYTAFTKPLVNASIISVVVGSVGFIFAKFIKKEVLHLHKKKKR
jgi:hypothetical protein